MPIAKRSLRGLLSVLAAVSLPLSQTLAVDGTWNTTSGNWSGTGNWASGIVADGVGSTAYLSQATGTPTITIQNAETFTVGLIDYSHFNAEYNIAGPGTLNFDGGSGDPGKIELSTGAIRNMGLLSTNVTGSNGLEIYGTSDSDVYLDWDPSSMALTGGVTLTDVTIRLFNTGAFGTNQITMGSAGGSNAILNFEDAQTVANDIVLAASGTPNAFRYGDASTTALQDINISGEISETGGSRDIAYITETGAGRGRFVVSGNNTYTGDTTIGGQDTGTVILQATNDGSLGAGSGVDVTFGADNTALELSGGVSIAGKNLTLRGFGDDSLGSLRSANGNNTWTGNISTGTSGAARIGVAADRLTISGIISGAEGMEKVSSGVLELTNANTYTTTTVHAGTLLLSNDAALGTGHVQVRPNGTLSVATGISAAVSSFEIINNGNLEFSLNGLVNDTGLVVSGNMTGLGTDSYDVFILDDGIVNQSVYTLMTVGGTSPGAASFNLNMAPGFEGSTLDWSGGVLTLNVVPEPATGVLMGLGLGLLALGGSRRNRR